MMGSRGDGIMGKKLTVAIVPQIETGNTAVVSAILDMANWEKNTLMLCIGTLTDANATTVVLLEDGDDSGLSDAAAVDDAFLVGTELLAAFQFDDDIETRMLGYIGKKRYIRMTVTPSGNSGNIPVSALLCQENGRRESFSQS